MPSNINRGFGMLGKYQPSGSNKPGGSVRPTNPGNSMVNKIRQGGPGLPTFRSQGQASTTRKKKKKK